MIFLDTNVFLRAVVEPKTEQDIFMADWAIRLFRSIETSSLLATTCDAVLAEVVFTLRGHTYRLSDSEIAERILPLILLPGLRSDQKRTWIYAFQLWIDQPSLSIVDALAAACSIHHEYELATFDRRLSRAPGVRPYQP